jgi:hypothetical protein
VPAQAPAAHLLLHVRQRLAQWQLGLHERGDLGLAAPPHDLRSAARADTSISMRSSDALVSAAAKARRGPEMLPCNCATTHAIRSPVSAIRVASARSSGSTMVASEPPAELSEPADEVGLSEVTAAVVSGCPVGVCPVRSCAVMRSVSVTDFLSFPRVLLWCGGSGVQLIR